MFAFFLCTGVISEAYLPQSHWNSFTCYCIDRGIITEEQNHDTFWKSLPAKLPTWVVGWIMSRYLQLRFTQYNY